MRRRLFKFAAAASLVVCVGTAVLWLVHKPASFTIDFSRDSHLYVGCGGRFEMSVITIPHSPPYFSVPVSNPAPLYAWIDMMRKRPSIAGFEFGRRYMVISGGGIQLAASAIIRDDGFRIPAWFIVLLTAVLPLWWVRTVRNKPDGRYCLTCGYDLTGNTSGVCPECGTPVAAKAGING